MAFGRWEGEKRRVSAVDEDSGTGFHGHEGGCVHDKESELGGERYTENLCTLR